MDIMQVIILVLVIVYCALGYWATGVTVYANKILIGTGANIFFQRLSIGILFGIVLIPVALIKVFILRK